MPLDRPRQARAEECPRRLARLRQRPQLLADFYEGTAPVLRPSPFSLTWRIHIDATNDSAE